MNLSDLQPQLEQPYRRENWQSLLPQLFPSVELFTQPHDFPLTSDHERCIATARRQFGSATLADGKRIAFYEIQAKPSVHLLANRAGLRSLVVRCIDEVSAHAVFAFFAQDGLEPYRLTYAAKESKLGDDLKVHTAQTATRRYTYILGPGEKRRTAAERLTTLARKQQAVTLADATDAFSVEKLNSEFFADYCRVFQRVRQDIAERHQRWSKEIVEQQTQTLLNRLLFLSFVQRKGWLNQQRDYLVQNFRQHFDQAPKSTSYLDKFLRPVFEKLSTAGPVADITDHALPFLNGGLFSDEYGAEQLDETLRRHKNLKVSNATFQHVFDDLLQIYNFTIREDSPTDQEVAIDPEMLGKIFESLVLQIEKSDGGTESLRHDTGSHYTPRPIVHYLCTEGLRGWLEQFPPSPARAATWPQRLEKLLAIDAGDGIDESEHAILDDCLSPEEAKIVLDRLETLRACDPAVGSGAFPVGLLHELINLMRLCETRSRGKDPVTRDSNWLYDTKSAIIRRVIYGVDIQERAVEICKLRLWLSLMVDFDIGVDVDNCSRSAFRAALKNITPLPNLEYKIRRADSLIDQVCGHPVILPRSLQDASAFNDALNKLSSAKLAFYSADNQRDKRKHHFDILAATADLALIVFKQAKFGEKNALGLAGGDMHEEDVKRIAELDQATSDMLAIQGQIRAARKLPAAQQDDELQRITAHFDDPERPTFVWQLDFAEVFHRKDAAGFGLMLANPPYVRQELLIAQKPMLQNAFPEVYTGTADLYCYFYALAIRMLSEGGSISFISSNKWFRARYGERLREHIAKTCRVRSITDFGELPVFDTAATFPMIFNATKGEPQHGTIFTQVKSLEYPYPDVPELVRQRGQKLPQDAINGSKWTLIDAASSARLRKIVKAGMPLGEMIQGEFYRGVVTGLNDAFYINRAVKDLLIGEDHASEELIRPALCGDDIRRYEMHFRDVYLLRIPYGLTLGLLGHDVDKLSFQERARLILKEAKQGWESFESHYPAVAKHLQRFEKKARKRDDQGDFWWELRPCDYYKNVFEHAKIVFPQTGKESRFAMDEQGYDLDQTVYSVALRDWYVLAVLNSQIAFEYLKIKCSVLGDEDQGGRLRILTQYLKLLPIPDASSANRQLIGNLAQEAQRLHTQRRNRVERFLKNIGEVVTASNSRNPLEQPWTLQAGEFTRRAAKPSMELFTATRDETATLTEEIDKAEKEIDARVAALYGL